jgi:hypothetical protein
MKPAGLASWVMSGAFEVLLPTYYATQERADDLYAAMPVYARRGAYAEGVLDAQAVGRGGTPTRAPQASSSMSQ